MRGTRRASRFSAAEGGRRERIRSTIESASPYACVRQAFTEEANVSDPTEQQDSDDLDLEAETVKDLDVSEEQAGELRGGISVGGPLPSGQHQPA